MGADPNARNEHGCTPVYLACGYGRKEVVHEMVVLGADINIPDNSGYTPLHYACARNHKDVATILVELGADPNAKDLDGTTPINLACFRDRREIAIAMATCGGDPTIKDKWVRSLTSSYPHTEGGEIGRSGLRLRNHSISSANMLHYSLCFCNASCCITIYVMMVDRDA